MKGFCQYKYDILTYGMLYKQSRLNDKLPSELLVTDK